MMNQQAMDSLYSATYMEDYLDCVENLPDDIQRNMSRMRDLDIQYSKYMKELEAAMEDLMEQMDEEQREQELWEVKRKRATYTKARTSVQDILIKAQDIGDEKLQIAQNVQDNIENKARQLELDKKNLGEFTKLRPREYGRETENQEAKEERERPGMKRARRAKHEVYVPSIMGPSTLEVTSYVDAENEPKPSSSRAYNDKGNSSSDAQDRKNSTASQPERERVGSGKGRNNNNNSSSSNHQDHAVESVRSERGSGNGKNHQDSPAKNIKKEEKKKQGTKRKGGKQNKKDASPPDDTDTIDPDEPTYCLCDQISYGEMIGCDNDLCPIEWFHFSCVNLTHKPKGKWYCPRCRGDKPNVMKNRTVLMKELSKYNREREEKA